MSFTAHRLYFPTLFLVLLLVIPCTIHAQSSVWNSRDIKQAGSGKLTKGRSTLKTYKEHLQHWGLDSNYRHGLLVGGRVNTNGWSGCVYYQTKTGATSSNIWQLSFSEVKHDKQVKQQGSNKSYPELGNTSPFVFGKINNLYTLQLRFGKEKLLVPGVMEGNIALSIRYSGGLSLAMLKPYYLKLVYVDYSQPNDPATLKTEKYGSANADHFLNSGDVLGAASWSKGLDEMTYVPGAFAAVAFAIEPARNKTFIQVITLGINASVYTKSLPIMADRTAYPWQASLFAGLALGKRWK